MSDLRVPLAVALGITFIVLGVLAKVGLWRRWETWQSDPGMPFLFRNAWAAMIPGGVAFVAVGAAGSMLPIAASSLLLPSLGLVTAFISLFLAVVAAYRPPRWLKPRWLQDRELAEGVVQSGTTFDRVLLTGMLLASVGGVGLFAAMLLRLA